MSSFVDKVTTGTYKFVSVILNVAFVGAFILSYASTGGSASGSAFLTNCVVILVKAQLLDQVKVKDSLQLIKGMSKYLQKLLEYFNETTISRFLLAFMFPYWVFSPFSWFAFDFFPVILLLYLKPSEFVIGSAL